MVNFQNVSKSCPVCLRWSIIYDPKNRFFRLTLKIDYSYDYSLTFSDNIRIKITWFRCWWISGNISPYSSCSLIHALHSTAQNVPKQIVLLSLMLPPACCAKCPQITSSLKPTVISSTIFFLLPYTFPKITSPLITISCKAGITHFYIVKTWHLVHCQPSKPPNEWIF